MNTIEKMFCPSCGAPIVFEEGREDTFCSHCGAQLHRDDENVVRRMEHIEKKMEYADRHEERVFQEKKAAAIRKEEIIGVAISLVLLILAMIFLKP